MEGKDGGEGWGEGSGVLSRPAEVKQALFAEPPSPALPLGQSAQTLQLATAGLPQKPSCHFQRGWGGAINCPVLPMSLHISPPGLSCGTKAALFFWGGVAGRGRSVPCRPHRTFGLVVWVWLSSGENRGPCAQPLGWVSFLWVRAWPGGSGLGVGWGVSPFVWRRAAFPPVCSILSR